ncbi:MAG: hypothetical protein PQJ59_19205 [Spirochaetales bacterium]|nr:hypothetical protein [Spirochaetales bacterium]
MRFPKRVFIALTAFPLISAGCSLLADNTFTDDPTDGFPSVLTKEKWVDDEGWSEFTPSEEAYLIYISESGDDDTGQVYLPGDDEIGEDPLNPVGTIYPFATYDAASEVARENYGDWILFKRGEEFTASLAPISGLSTDYPALIAAYGSSGVRPIISPVVNDSDDTDKIEYSSCVSLFCRRGRDCINSVILNLDFYNSAKDPDLGDPENTSSGGMGIMALGEGSEEGTIQNILLEGCRFRYFDNNTIQKLSDGVIENFIIKRCQILDNYKYTTDNGHSQGLYCSYIDGLFLIENVFDHNGWLNQASSTEDLLGEGTMFNHNTYFTDCSNVEFYHNISLRPSSIHHKFTAQNGEASATNIEMNRNILVDGEVGISLGGNDSTPYRFKDILVYGNLVTEQGRTRPTNRYLGWGIDVQDWDGGYVLNNLVVNFYDQGDNNNNYGFSLTGGFRDVIVKNNKVWDVYGTALHLYDRDGDYRENNAITYNYLQGGLSDKSWVKMMSVYDLTGVSFCHNSYSYDGGDEPFRYDDEYCTFKEWTELSEDRLSEMSTEDFFDSDRTIALYNSTMAGGEESIDDFIDGCRAQSPYDWNEAYEAGNILSWFNE